MPKTANAFEAYGTTIFCEDIRFELSGSVSLVGVFTKYLIVPRLPIIIPRLGIYTCTILPPLKKKSIKSKLLVYLPEDGDDPSIVSDDSTSNTDKEGENWKKDADIMPHSKVIQQIIISPLQIDHEGFIKVRTKIDDAYIKAGILRVVVKPQNAAQ